MQSGGIAPYARDGALVSLDARLVLRDEGIHLPPDSVATDLKTNRHLIAEADLILAMTDEQIRMLRAAFPEAAGKEIYTLKQFAGSRRRHRGSRPAATKRSSPPAATRSRPA